MLVIGVDPGLHGAIAFYRTDNQTFEVYDMPLEAGKICSEDLAELVKNAIFDNPTHTHAIIEEVHGRPRQKGVFNFGFSTGLVHGVLAGRATIHTVSPVKWKAAMGLYRQPLESPEEFKDRSRILAKAFFPESKDFDRKKDDGRAEALLLALYFAHKMN